VSIASRSRWGGRGKQDGAAGDGRGQAERSGRGRGVGGDHLDGRQALGDLPGRVPFLGAVGEGHVVEFTRLQLPAVGGERIGRRPHTDHEVVGVGLGGQGPGMCQPQHGHPVVERGCQR